MRNSAKRLEPPPVGVAARGTSKSAASRHLMTDQLREQLTRRLDALDLLVLLLDGVEVARRTVGAALGILADGRKVVLGLWRGSTENAALATALLQNLLERGLKVEGRTLCVIDGGRGLRKALTEVFGDLVVVQRCQVHKKRNVLDHLLQPCKNPVAHALSAAWASDSPSLRGAD
jgi:putative transposase